MKKHNKDNKVRYLASQLDNCARIGITLHQENVMLRNDLVQCRITLERTKKDLDREQSLRTCDKNGHDATVRVLCDKINDARACCNTYKCLFWSLVVLYSVLTIAHIVITRFYAR